MTMGNGGFARRNAPDDTISGRFYGPGQEEVGGALERDRIAWGSAAGAPPTDYCPPVGGNERRPT